MNVNRVVPILAVARIDPAVDMLTGVLGMEVVMNHGWIATLADPHDRSKQISVLTQDATAPVNPCVSIEVDDVDAVYRAAVDAGAAIVHPLTDEAWGARRFFFRDLDGNVINVLAHR